MAGRSTGRKMNARPRAEAVTFCQRCVPRSWRYEGVEIMTNANSTGADDTLESSGSRLAEVVVDPPLDDAEIDPMAWFETLGPLEIEIGCGKGGFLLSRARNHPEIRLLGIEWASKYYRHCADRMARWRLTNVRVMRADAKDLFIRNLPRDCVSVLHLYHPDPWPKKRHHKRRLVAPAFIDAVVRVLTPGGHWLIQSDHAEYFGSIREQLDDRAEFSEVAWDELPFDRPDDWQGTNFEIKYRRDGRDIHRVAYRAT